MSEELKYWYLRDHKLFWTLCMSQIKQLCIIVGYKKAILILIPCTTLLGALLGLGTMAGALFSHILFLGIEVKNDGGTLFILAIITFLCCLLLIYNQKSKIPDLLKFKL